MLIISNCSIAETYQGVAFWRGLAECLAGCALSVLLFWRQFFLAMDHCTGMGPAIPPFLPPAISGTVMLSTLSIGRGEKKNEKSCLGLGGGAVLCDTISVPEIGSAHGTCRPVLFVLQRQDLGNISHIGTLCFGERGGKKKPSPGRFFL